MTLTSLSEYRDRATISKSIRVSAWNSFFSALPFTVSAGCWSETVLNCEVNVYFTENIKH